MKKKGFTIIELIIVIALITLLAALATPFLGASYDRSNIEVSAFDLQQSLRVAISKSMASNGNSSWGVYIADDYFVLYKGDSYATRDVNFDLTTKSRGDVTFAGIDEINFSKNFGLPSVVGNITASDSNNNFKTININSLARIQVQ